RQVAAGGVAGQNDLVGFIPLPAQPSVAVVAVVNRVIDGMLRDLPVLHHQHRTVGVLGQLGDEPTVRVGAAGQEGAPVHVQHDSAGAVGGQHTGGAHQLSGAVRQPDGGADSAGWR